MDWHLNLFNYIEFPLIKNICNGVQLYKQISKLRTISWCIEADSKVWVIIDIIYFTQIANTDIDIHITKEYNLFMIESKHKKHNLFCLNEVFI